MSLSIRGPTSATRQTTRADSSGVLMVSVLPSFAAKWLVPRIGKFRERHPDVGIRYGRSGWTGLRVEGFLTEEFFPVCRPALLDGPNPLRQPEHLSRQTLLHDDYPVGLLDWREWLRTVGAYSVDATRGPGSGTPATSSRPPSKARALRWDARRSSPATLRAADSCGSSKSACPPTIPTTWSCRKPGSNVPKCGRSRCGYSIQRRLRRSWRTRRRPVD